MYNISGTSSSNYLEVNQWTSNFSSYSRNSISGEYDGNYLVTNANYNRGVLYNDQGDLFWKGLYSGNPSFMDELAPGAVDHRQDNFSLATSPVESTIDVISEDDAPATFQLMDNAGRIIEMKSVLNEGNNYSIDINHLSGGMYFLHCSSAAGEEVLRVLQVRK